MARGSDIQIGPSWERMDGLDSQARQVQELDFWQALAAGRVADGNLCFGYPFDLVSSAGLAANRYRQALAVRMFHLFIKEHVRRFDIVIEDAYRCGVVVLSLRARLDMMAAALDMCKAKLAQWAGQPYRYRIQVHEAAGALSREILDTEVTHPATAAAVLDDVLEELQGEGATE